MPDPIVPPDPAEPDLYWAGASGWAMLPGVLVGVALSAIAMFALPPLGSWIGLDAEWTAFGLFWLTVIAWVLAGLTWAYRGASYVFRLTPTRLYLEFGRLSPPVRPIELRDVTAVEVRGWRLRQLFGVGSVIVRSTGREPVRMRGIYRPTQFAKAIQSAIANGGTTVNE